MRRLSKDERETIISTSEADVCWRIYTHNRKLKNRLEIFAQQNPEVCKLDSSDSTGAVSYIIDKARLSIRFTHPYTKERTSKASELATEINKRKQEK